MKKKEKENKDTTKKFVLKTGLIKLIVTMVLVVFAIALVYYFYDLIIAGIFGVGLIFVLFIGFSFRYFAYI